MACAVLMPRLMAHHGSSRRTGRISGAAAYEERALVSFGWLTPGIDALWLSDWGTGAEVVKHDH